MPALRLLADGSCDFSVVRGLRDEGSDVLAVAKIMQRSVDRELIQQAAEQERVLLTEDKDFGWLLYVSHAESASVILIRIPGNARRMLMQTDVDLVQERGNDLMGAFVVVEPGLIRITRRPRTSD